MKYSPFDTFGANEEAKFYQVLGEDLPIRILYSWKKGLSQLNNNNSDIRMFSEQKETFILRNNKLVRFNGNRSLAGKFSSTSKTPIKKYLRKNKTKVKHATDDEMELLIEFINTVDTQGNK